MTVSNGQLANQTSFNTAFMSRTVDTDTIGKVGLVDTDVVSGTGIDNAQRELNALASFLGGIVNQAKTYLPTWATSFFGNASDSIKERIEAIDAAFNPSGGALAARSGRVAIGTGEVSLAVVFSTPWSDEDFSLVVSIENVTESDPIFLQPIISARSAAGFTAKWNAPTDSANYFLNYQVKKAA